LDLEAWLIAKLAEKKGLRRRDISVSHEIARIAALNGHIFPVGFAGIISLGSGEYCPSKTVKFAMNRGCPHSQAEQSWGCCFSLGGIVFEGDHFLKGAIEIGLRNGSYCP